jgi:hypothetical protein
MADLGAAFGFYPQLNRRRQGSPADSANLPVDVLRGRLAGLLGAPADIANLLRSPQPTEMFGNVSYEAPAQFPYTTEKFLKDLPLAPTSRVGQVAGQAASFVPLNPMPAVRGVQRVGQMAGEELAATMLGQRPNTMMSKVVPQPLFAVPPEQGLLSARAEPIESLLQTKPQAPVSDIGFYSATEQAALNLGRNKGTGQSFINDLMKAPDVKKEELVYTGLDDFLRDKPNVTKQEVQDFLANNRVDVQEVRLGDAPPPAPPPVLDAERLNFLEKEFSQLKEHPIDAPNFGQEKFEELMMLQNIRDNSTVESLYSRADSATSAAQRAQSRGNKDIAERYFREAEMLNSRAEALDLKGLGVPEQVITNPTQFDKYTLAGGENYREILLTLPQKPKALPEGFNVDAYSVNGVTKYGVYDANGQRYGSGATKEEALQRFSDLHQDKPYQSSHFKEPNILAHMRVNDRIDADGKKMLLVEEIQSDWHQAGRERGYGPKYEESFMAYYDTKDGQRIPIGYGKTKEEAEATIDVGWKNLVDIKYETHKRTISEGVPDAPFKDTWYQLALKRLTKYAAENGYERIGLTTGKQQAGRYKLSNEVDEINVIGRTNMATGEKSKSVALDMKSGQSLRIGVNNDGIVDNVSDESIKNFMGKNLSEVVGKDIAKEIMLNNKKTISGEGLDIGGEGMKKYYDEIYPKFLDKYGKKYGASVGETQITTDYARDASGIPAQRPSKETIRYLDITPQMKKGTSKGQPLFAATPLLPATSLLDEEKRKEITSLLE